ncbi:Oidioi.mRNA.OKI2018_I69.XSR.g14455.t2.cds [Oikopleura dioica]|uniref:Oidioi.mRNA.OKI2018_I69.XSR.g14455.t2.cds n=1 Tax=Oikopleura dioica TaxID=34765 RepID=A0ABN7S9U1_OIKDI|nr:Oidioi.mRNA.OKI2018_I69.XSR.g14455.t2.cds [Oikopleura dioica]
MHRKVFQPGLVLLAALVSAEDLVITKPLRDKTYKLFSSIELECSIHGAEEFTWEKDGDFLDEENVQSIINDYKKFTSTINIDFATTVDGGKYKCCGRLKSTNDSRCTSATINVAVDQDTNPKLPDTGSDVPVDNYCFKYPNEHPGICGRYLKYKSVHIQSEESIPLMENIINNAFEQLKKHGIMTEQCYDYAPKAFCHYLLPECTESGETKQLCPADCEMMRHSYCASVFENLTMTENEELYVVANELHKFNCENLAAKQKSQDCLSIGLPAVLNTSQTCYESNGIGYRGNVNKNCVKWEDVPNLADKEEYKIYGPSNFPELSGGHRYCRNPISQNMHPDPLLQEPWCFVQTSTGTLEPQACEVQECPKETLLTKEALIILLPSVAVSLVLGILVIAWIACRKRNPKAAAKGDHLSNVDNRQSSEILQQQETRNLSNGLGMPRRIPLPELPAGSVHCRKELGEAFYGTVYLAEIAPNLLYAPTHPVAAKSLAAGSNTQQIHQFWREIEMLQELRHDRIASLRAVVITPSFRSMIFEYTDLGDLKNFLLSKNPNSDIYCGSPMNAQTQLHICLQIAEGMDYLSSGERPYVHRDLAARNILIDSQMRVKISNIGIARAETASDYFNPQVAAGEIGSSCSPQTLIPVRWMSPESLLKADYTTASDVWSFAVCCWEVYSYGTQPYLGYTDEGVMELVIHRKQVLPCPDGCPLPVYNLLINCWAYNGQARPVFSKIVSQLETQHRNLPQTRQFHPGPRSHSSSSTSSFQFQSSRNKNISSNIDARSHISPSTESTTVSNTQFVPNPYENSWKSSVRPHPAPPASPASHSNNQLRYPTGALSTSSSAGSSAGHMYNPPEELLRPLLPNSQNLMYKEPHQPR